MYKNIYCPKCRGTYVELRAELVGGGITCSRCGFQYTIPVNMLEEEAVAIRRSFRRIFFWSGLLSLVFSLLFLMAAIFTSGQRGAPSPLLALVFFPLYTFWFSSLAFGFKALAVESGCLAILYLTFGNLGAVVGALFLGPVIGPFHALLLWLRLRRNEARLAELRGGRAGTAPTTDPAPRSRSMLDQTKGPAPRARSMLDQRNKRKSS